MAETRGYDDLIMDHIKNARGYRALDDATHHASGHNPLCGDEMTVYAKVDGDRIESVSYQCTCCGISMASASMMTELLQEQSRAEVKTWLEPFIASIIAHGEPPDAATDPTRHALLKTVRDLPVRTPCAALPWVTLAAALDGRTDTVSVSV
jgi:nitrogen fixation NifU-like protein